MGTYILLLLLPVLVFGYNLDISRPILYSDPSVSIVRNSQNDSSSNYFGYSIILYHSTVKNSSWLIVGAPRGNYILNGMQKSSTNPGVAYRCQLFGKKCRQVMPTNPYDTTLYSSSLVVHKAESWFGAAMSIYEPDDVLTICAPRTTVTVNYCYNDCFHMRGLCYSGSITSRNMKAEVERAFEYGRNINNIFSYIRGFSIKYSTTKTQSAIGIEGIPFYNGYGFGQLIGSIASNTLHTIIRSKEFTTGNVAPYAGYSVATGCFFKKNELMFASGAPQWNYRGGIIIIDQSSNAVIVPSIVGKEVHECFGASLAAGDLNNDGLDDLIVGAPHSGYDNGKVYIYFGSETGKFVTGAAISGNVEGGQFGYSLVSGDLDGDGFAELIVGAPWEDSGVIYVFNGRSGITEDTLLRPSQRISGSDIFHGLQRFGYTFSEPIDIDGNGYPEVAIGAYKSGHVVILRGTPVVKTIVNIQIYPSTLSKNSTSFQLETCIDLLSKKTYRIQKYKIEAKIDEDLKRIKASDLKSLQYVELSKGSCINYSFTLASEINNFLDPIDILLRYRIAEKSEKTVVIIGDKGDQDDTFCATCAVESIESSSKWIQRKITFDFECGNDKLCQSNITANAIFIGVRDNDTWIIGSDDISLKINLENHGEIAYLTMVVFSLPSGVTLRNILPSCQENRNNSMTVTCDVKNLATAINKSVQLDFDMKALHDGSLHNKVLNFTMTIETRSINQGISKITLPLHLMTEAALTITGKANEESYYFSRSNENNLNITFRHAYQILKLGATPISDSELTVDVPLATENNSYFLSVYKPQLYIADKHYECYSPDIVWFMSHTVNTIMETDKDNTDILSLIRVHQRMKRNSENSTNSALVRVNEMLTNQTDLSREERNETIYLNCSTPGVQCGRIKCDLSELKTKQDIGKLFIKMVLDVSKFNASSPDITRLIQLSLDANVTVIRPSISLPIAETISMINVTTAFTGTAKNVQTNFLPIILGSVFLGLLLLCVITGILCRIGFFKRQIKKDLIALKADTVEMEPTCSD